MRKLIVLMVALGLGAGAQEAGKWQQRVFDVKYASVPALTALVQSLVQGKETRVVDNRGLNAISVGTREPADMAMAEELIKRYDVPGMKTPAGNRNIELVAYMLMAAPKGTAGDALPAELDGVAKQLKAVFGYGDLRLLDSLLVRTREGVPAEASGNAGVTNPVLPNAPALYDLRIARTAVNQSERGTVIRFDGFKFRVRVPYPTASFQPGQGATGVSPLVSTQFQYSEVGFNTELDIREGQKVVVGKAKVDATGSAFVLVLTAKAID